MPDAPTSGYDWNDLERLQSNLAFSNHLNAMLLGGQFSSMPISPIKPKKGERLRALVDFIFGFENKKGETLDYWIAFLDDFSYSPQEFYQNIEGLLQRQRIPGLETSREEFMQGGLLSEKRIYFRLFRERLAIYTCAASFGSGYFFSCRTVYVPALVRLWHLLATVFLFGAAGLLLLYPLGFTYTIIALVGLVFAIGAVLRNASSSHANDVDAFILKIPVISTIYEDWFRADTYWRQDTRAIYLQRIPLLIKELAGEVSAANGARFVQQYQHPPSLGSLFKPDKVKDKASTG